MRTSITSAIFRATHRAGPPTHISTRSSEADRRLTAAIVAQATLEGNAEALIALDPDNAERVARIRANVAAGRRALEKEQNMSKPVTTLAEARAIWEGTKAAHQQLKDVQILEEEGRVSHEYATGEIKRLRDLLRITDSTGRDAMRVAVEDTMERARLLRSEYDSSLDPMTVTADELTASRLTKSGSPVDLIARAQQLIADGQVRAARAYILAIGTLEPRPEGAGPLLHEYQQALHASDPTLRKASDLEALATETASAFDVERSQWLTATGLGVDRAGDPGDGSPGQRAQSSLHAKLEEWRTHPEVAQPIGTPEPEE